jgi:hypothetical protein
MSKQQTTTLQHRIIDLVTGGKGTLYANGDYAAGGRILKGTEADELAAVIAEVQKLVSQAKRDAYEHAKALIMPKRFWETPDDALDTELRMSAIYDINEAIDELEDEK